MRFMILHHHCCCAQSSPIASFRCILWWPHIDEFYWVAVQLLCGAWWCRCIYYGMWWWWCGWLILSDRKPKGSVIQTHSWIPDQLEIHLVHCLLTPFPILTIPIPQKDDVPTKPTLLSCWWNFDCHVIFINCQLLIIMTLQVLNF